MLYITLAIVHSVHASLSQWTSEVIWSRLRSHATVKWSRMWSSRWWL